jgi:hypothetical protein
MQYHDLLHIELRIDNHMKFDRVEAREENRGRKCVRVERERERREKINGGLLPDDSVWTDNTRRGNRRIFEEAEHRIARRWSWIRRTSPRRWFLQSQSLPDSLHLLLRSHT